MDFRQEKTTEIIIQLCRGGLAEDLVLILSGAGMTKENVLRQISRFLDDVRSGEMVTILCREKIWE